MIAKAAGALAAFALGVEIMSDYIQSIIDLVRIESVCERLLCKESYLNEDIKNKLITLIEMRTERLV